MFALASFISVKENTHMGINTAVKMKISMLQRIMSVIALTSILNKVVVVMDYSHIINMIMNREVSDVNKKFKPFKKVLRQTNLLSYTNIYPKKDVNKCK